MDNADKNEKPVPPTISLEKMVLEHPLYLSIRDAAHRGGLKRNFAVFAPNSKDTPIVFHGKEFGDATFYRNLSLRNRRQGKSYFDNHVSLDLLKRVDLAIVIPQEIENAGQSSVAAKWSGGDPYRKAKDTAWMLFDKISNPYAEEFRNSEVNAARHIARYADPTALSVAMEHNPPYKVFVVQDQNIDDLHAVMPPVEGPRKSAYAYFDSALKRLYFSTGRKYPLSHSPESVADYLRTKPGYEQLFALNVTHEFGHLVNFEHPVSSEIIPSQKALGEVLSRESEHFTELFLYILTRLDKQRQEQDEKLIDATVREILRLRGKNPDRMTVSRAYDVMRKDLNRIAKDLAPGVDFRNSPIKDYLTRNTLQSIDYTFRYYETDEKRLAENHADMHELCTIFPREYIAGLFPETLQLIRSDAEKLHSARIASTSHLDRLKRGKPILIWGPESISPKGGNSR